jgi:hypothetical protein
MLERLAQVIYWACSAVACLVVLVGLVYAVSTQEPGMTLGLRAFAAVLSFVVAGIIWLVGRAALYVLADD